MKHCAHHSSGCFFIFMFASLDVVLLFSFCLNWNTTLDPSTLSAGSTGRMAPPQPLHPPPQRTVPTLTAGQRHGHYNEGFRSTCSFFPSATKLLNSWLKLRHAQHYKTACFILLTLIIILHTCHTFYFVCLFVNMPPQLTEVSSSLPYDTVCRTVCGQQTQNSIAQENVSSYARH